MGGGGLKRHEFSSLKFLHPTPNSDLEDKIHTHNLQRLLTLKREFGD